MNSTQFTEQLHKLGYETTTDGGAIIIIGKYDSFDENLKEAQALVKEYGFECSWGVRGGTAGAETNGKKKPAVKSAIKTVETPSDVETLKDDDIADKTIFENANLGESNLDIDTCGSFEQMSLMDFM